MSLGNHSLASVSLAGSLALAGFIPPDPIPPISGVGGTTPPTEPRIIVCLNSDRLNVGTGLQFDNLGSIPGLTGDNLNSDPPCTD